jgi:integrase
MATITKRGSAYRIKVSCGYSVDGKQVVQSTTYKPEAGMTAKQIEKEVHKRAVLFEQECQKGQITTSIKFETFAGQYFDEYAKQNLRHTTYVRYQQFTKKVFPALGHLRLDKVTTRNVQLFINSLSQNGANEVTGKPLAPKTVRLYQGFISNIFSYAIKMSMLTDNPCSRVTLPKLDKKEKPIYTLEETERFLSFLEDEPLQFRVFFTLAIYSGFRRGELLGIEWKDIDWQGGVIKICRTSNYTKQKGTFTDTTKTAKSKRSMKFPTHVLDLLNQYRTEQAAYAQSLGDKWEEYDRVFVGATGRPLTTSLPYKWLSKFCEKNGLPCYGVHHYRHLFASLLFKEGMDIVSVSGALGHTNPNITLGVYSHMFGDTQIKVAEAVTKALDFTKTKEGK